MGQFSDEKEKREQFGFAGSKITEKSAANTGNNKITDNSAANAGIKWELDALAIVGEKHEVFSKEGEDGSKGKYNEKEFVDILKELYKRGSESGINDPVYVYQAGLLITRSFYKKHITGISDEEIDSILNSLKK